MKKFLAVLSASFILSASTLVVAEQRFSVNRSGGVDASGANTDGSLQGYRSGSFADLATLNAPTVDLSQIQNEITNIQNQVNSNVTTMNQLVNRVNNAESAVSSAQSTADGARVRADQAYSLANQAMSKANSAYSLADSAYTKAGSATSTASSAYNMASGAVTSLNWSTSSTSEKDWRSCEEFKVTKHYLNGSYKFTSREYVGKIYCP